MQLDRATFDPRPFIDALDGDLATFLEFVTNFLDEYADSIEGVHAAARRGDCTALRERTHALKGTVAFFRAEKMLRELEAIERTCRTCSEMVYADLTRPLATASAAFEADLRALCRTMGTDAAVPVAMTRT